jgi:hypothetical protein
MTSSLTRGWVCHLQLVLAFASAFILRYEFRGTRDNILLSQIRDFCFRRLLRLAGLRWRCSTPLPHGSIRPRLLGSWLYSLGTDPTENTASNHFYIVVTSVCLAVTPDIVDMFAGRYQAKHVLSCDRCIATVLHATIWFRRIYAWKCVDQLPLLQRVSCWRRANHLPCPVGVTHISLESEIKLKLWTSPRPQFNATVCIVRATPHAYVFGTEV